MLVEDIILIEANVEPKSLDLLDKFIHEMGEDLEETNPGINHNAFLKRLKKDIVNNNRIFGAQMQLTALVPYKPKKTDPDFIKNATEEVYTVNPKALEYLRDDLLELFIPDFETEPDTPTALFNKFHELVKSPDGLDPNIANKLLPIKKKYEQGKFDLPGLKNAMQVMTQLGAQKWKHDSAERQRLETEAPIIMKFKNGMKWVRLDSQEEMKREGGMMQNCISGYCPVGSSDGDLTLGLRDKFAIEMDGEPGTDDDAHDWLVTWLDENDTDVQDYIMNQMGDLPDAIEDALDTVLDMDEEEAFDWMLEQIIEADADEETGLMHSGHLIYSLRDKNGESHIAAEYDPNVDMNYIEPEEALGKQNEPPVEKYKPYIEKLNDFFMEHPETFGPAGNTQDMPFHPDYDKTESIEEGDLIPNPVNTVAIKTMSDGDFYNLSKYMGDLDKASPEEFGMPDSAAVITFQDEEEMDFVLKRIKKHTGMQGHDISGHDDPGDSKTWGDKKGFKKNQGSDEEPLSLVGKKLDRMKNLAGKPHERRFDDHIERLKHLAGI